MRTLGFMTARTDNVIAFPGVRVAAEPATLVIGAVLHEEPQSVTRVFGINDQLTLNDFSRVLQVLFGWEGTKVPTRFELPGAEIIDLPGNLKISEVLQNPGDKISWQWGLWQHKLEVREAFARDDATPDALCIGGSGAITTLSGDAACHVRSDTFDIAAINEELTGEESIQTTLSAARPEIVDLIERSSVFEFIPLLQALDLRRECGCVGGAEGTVAKRMRSLPAESRDEDPAGYDAALTTLLCLAALTSDDVRHDVSEHVMESVGWVGDDGVPLGGEDIEALCPATWQILEQYGLVGEKLAAPIARLDLLREALRR